MLTWNRYLSVYNNFLRVYNAIACTTLSRSLLHDIRNKSASPDAKGRILALHLDRRWFGDVNRWWRYTLHFRKRILIFEATSTGTAKMVKCPDALLALVESGYKVQLC